VAVLRSMALPPDIRMTRVRSEREARRLGFHGSPTVRVNGADIDPQGAARLPEPGLYSREYAWSGRREDIPPEALIRRAIEEAARGAVA